MLHWTTGKTLIRFVCMLALALLLGWVKLSLADSSRLIHLQYITSLLSLINDTDLLNMFRCNRSRCNRRRSQGQPLVSSQWATSHVQTTHFWTQSTLGRQLLARTKRHFFSRDNLCECQLILIGLGRTAVIYATCTPGQFPSKEVTLKWVRSS
jgi:hypothetical protein